MNDKKDKIAELLRNNPDIEFAYLFGSKVKGTANKRSDWDIAIYFKKNLQDLPQWRVFYLEAEISKEIGEEVQISALNDLNSPVFLFQIIKEGLLLIDNNTQKRIIWEVKVSNSYHDWQYFLKRQMESVQSKA